MLQLQQLDKRYPTGDLALKSVSLNVASGEVLGLIGPSGAGKSTLIRCVNRLVQPTAGQIMLDGQAFAHLFIDPPPYYLSQGLGLRLACSSAMAISPIKGAA
jgi:ABC-type methionine transport system ATPase subunit